MITPEHFFVNEMASPLGTLTIIATERGVCQIHFAALHELNGQSKLLKTGVREEWERCESRTSAVCEQLQAYFNGTRKSFDVDIDLVGTPFQKKVWRALMDINYGETRSYKEIAKQIGAPKAVRAIGGANNRNPLPIIVPCHRVIGSNGAMVGYGGGLNKKELLLHLEGALTIS
ncbi:methylated-DNA--[protein]-cysteine S-methyltransferase [Shouchella lonarensis]|uniref:Methylated-DNA--protein-cysteine methyltransferase n=1 Tax=Shouchella lonarensis TaxID=1464122 RepID=A0A1G6GJE1_9BACI|nr:methylated-DNA--[protein]-cysteine S-methyltransferase [Shouchella lonarensis]SDB82060.1 methylated-DNA-[protein]-cysteine S-methyltransferase [Shouchella lonarensis]